MSEIWKPLDIEVYRSWVEAIFLEASDDLNDWESSFVTNLANLLDMGRNLTQSQAQKLESIYAEKTK